MNRTFTVIFNDSRIMACGRDHLLVRVFVTDHERKYTNWTGRQRAGERCALYHIRTDSDMLSALAQLAYRAGKVTALPDGYSARIGGY